MSATTTTTTAAGAAPQSFRFDEKTAEQLSMIYMTEDIREMQRQFRVWFDPKPGETILDVGCGTGVNSLAIAKLVGPTGKVIGIDNSEHMLSLARQGASAANVEYRKVAVDQMDFAENSFDGVVCTQVLGYLADHPVEVIRKLLKVVKPTGRIFMAETDWDSLAYSIPDKELQRKVTMAFTDHQGDGWVGRRLYSWCQEAGPREIALHPYVIHNAELSTRRYGGPLSYVIRDFLLRTRKWPEAEVKRWLQQLNEAFDNKTYFFMLTRLVCVIRK